MSIQLDRNDIPNKSKLLHMLKITCLIYRANSLFWEKWSYCQSQYADVSDLSDISEFMINCLTEWVFSKYFRSQWSYLHGIVSGLQTFL